MTMSVMPAEAVAPLAGAWIEIVNFNNICVGKVSLPLRERGLKYKVNLNMQYPVTSLPLRERGLKLFPTL